MATYVVNKRTTTRINREIMVGIRTGIETKKVLTLDLSTGGVKVGGAMLKLPVGSPVQLMIENNGGQVSFLGKVAREDQEIYSNRISRPVTPFFIKITDSKFVEFVSAHYHL